MALSKRRLDDAAGRGLGMTPAPLFAGRYAYLLVATPEPGLEPGPVHGRSALTSLDPYQRGSNGIGQEMSAVQSAGAEDPFAATA